MSVTRWCPVSSARSAQKFGGKNKKKKNNMIQRGRGSAGDEGFRVLLLSGIQNFVSFARGGGFEERGEGNAREKFRGEG